MQYKDAHDMMKQTGLSPEECLNVVNEEIKKILREIIQ
jgi:hypothetical protein